MSDLPRVTILLATFNGARHLRAQLDSFAVQSHTAWDLWVSDDGSHDATWQILERFRADHGAGREIRLIRGPCRGAAVNFLTLLTRPDLPPGPVALSDQDDVWLRGKLARGLRVLGRSAPVTLYGAQSLHADAALKLTGRSYPPPRGPSLRNALVQNVVAGRTMILSAGARDLVARAGMPTPEIPYHDWWLYLLLSGAGAEVVIDPRVVMLYRQHGQNVIGVHQGPRATLLRAARVLGRDYRDWVAANHAALRAVAPLLSEEARALLAAIDAAPSGPARGRALPALGLHRQGRLGQVAFRLAAACGRI